MKITLTREMCIARSKQADKRFQESLKKSDGAGDMVKPLPKKRKRNKQKTKSIKK